MLHISYQDVFLLHSFDLVEYPPSLKSRANIIVIACQYSYWHMSNVLNRYIGGQSEPFIFRIVV